jgi:hypothetical protein
MIPEIYVLAEMPSIEDIARMTALGYVVSICKDDDENYIVTVKKVSND